MKINQQSTSYLSLLLSLCLVFNCSFGQDSQPYQWSTVKDVPLLALGATGSLTSLILKNQNDPLSLQEINGLNQDDLFALDLGAIDNYSPASQRASDVLLWTSYALPLSTLLIPETRQNLGMITVMLAEGILLNEALTGITKTLVNRPRPYAFNADLANEIRTNRDNNLSFFSGHTSYTAMFSFFTAQVLSDQIENPNGRALMWAGAAILPAATGYFRYDGGKHFVSDVVLGYLVGASIGYFIPKLHQEKEAASETKGFHLDREASHMSRLVFVF